MNSRTLTPEERYTASPTSPRYIVYFDGMTDVITIEEFAQHDWHIAFAGPLTSDAALDAAGHALTLETYAAEPNIEKSAGWQAAVMTHPFAPCEENEAYCATRYGSHDDIPCGQHARYHADAPERLRNAPLRLIRTCSFGDNYSIERPKCRKDGTKIVGENIFCDDHAANEQTTIPA